MFLTDNELGYRHPGGLEYRDYQEFCQDADLLIHDAEYTEDEYRRTKTWGHSTYKDALHLALDAKVKRLGLFHHNQDRTDAALDEIVEECRHNIEDRNRDFQCFAVASDQEIKL